MHASKSNQKAFTFTSYKFEKETFLNLESLQVHDRTHNPRIQELIMDLGETPETQSPERTENHVNGNPNFYSDDEGDLPYADCDQNRTESDKDILTTTVKSHHDFEVDPQTCWPCVGCQDDDVPTTVRWCSIM